MIPWYNDAILPVPWYIFILGPGGGGGLPYKNDEDARRTF